MKVLILAAMLAGSTPDARLAAAQPAGIAGLWDAIIVANDVEVPFRFEIASSGTRADGYFFEGDRKVGSTSGSYADGLLTLEYDFLNTTLQAKLEGDVLVGTYQNKRANAKPQAIRMQRFVPVALDVENVPALEGTWEMRRNADEVTAPRDTRTWHVFLRHLAPRCPGRFCALMATPAL